MDRPLNYFYVLETEEEYFLCSGGGAIDEAPDLGLIQEMLNMVRHSFRFFTKKDLKAVISRSKSCLLF